MRGKENTSLSFLFVQVFPLDQAVPAVPGVPLGGVPGGAVHWQVIVVQVGLGQDVAVLVHGPAQRGISGADVGPGVFVVQIRDVGHVHVVVIQELARRVSVLEDRRLVVGVDVGRPPDLALVAVFVPDAGVAAGDDHRAAAGVQIGLGDLPVLRVVGVGDRGVPELGFHGLHAGVQVFDPDQVAPSVIDPAGSRITQR